MLALGFAVHDAPGWGASAVVSGDVYSPYDRLYAVGHIVVSIAAVLLWKKEDDPATFALVGAQMCIQRME